jgi:hypothetical protein
MNVAPAHECTLVWHVAVAQVLGFASRVDAEDWMLAHPESTLGAVHFTVNEVPTPPSIQYSLQTNTTVSICSRCLQL